MTADWVLLGGAGMTVAGSLGGVLIGRRGEHRRYLLQRGHEQADKAIQALRVLQRHGEEIANSSESPAESSVKAIRKAFDQFETAGVYLGNDDVRRTMNLVPIALINPKLPRDVGTSRALFIDAVCQHAITILGYYIRPQRSWLARRITSRREKLVLNRAGVFQGLRPATQFFDRVDHLIQAGLKRVYDEVMSEMAIYPGGGVKPSGLEKSNSGGPVEGCSGS